MSIDRWINQCHFGDCIEALRQMPDGIVQTCVTSPPYFGLRSYLPDGHINKTLEIGLESTPEAYIQRMVEVFREVKRVLKDDGTCWINIADSYCANRSYQVNSTKGGKKHSESQSVGGKGSVVPVNCKPKDLNGIPWLLAFALRTDGWYLRQEIIWEKPNSMPESVTDRCTKSHEQIFLLSKSEQYYFDNIAIKEPATVLSFKSQNNHRSSRDSFKRENSKRSKDNPIHGQSNVSHRSERVESSWDTEMRNKRSVWSVNTRPYSGAHFAVFPPELIAPCILAGSPVGGVVLDPFGGSGTTAQVAQDLGRQWILCELNDAYQHLQNVRTSQSSLALF